MNLGMILLLVVAAVAGNVLLVWALRSGQWAETALRDLGQSQGWLYTKVKSSGRRAGYQELADPSGTWHLRLFAGGDGGASTQWTCPSRALPTGMAVYAPPLPEKTQMMINLMMNKAGGLGPALLASVFKGLGREAVALRMIEDDDPATLMATPGAEDAFDPLKGAEELHALNQFGKNVADVPFLVRSETGLTLRLNRRLKTPEDIQAFVAAARSISARFPGPT